MSFDLSAFTSVSREHKDDAIFISFEGIEGAGKSTQIKLLDEYLTSAGYEVTVMREPGGTTVGEKLRNTILKSDDQLSPMTETLIFLASRCELITQKILPLLKKKKQVVILDRYIDSTLSYQGVARGLGFQAILDLHKIKPLNILPNLTFYLSIDEKTSHSRQGARGDQKDYFEKENPEFYQNIKLGFDELSQLFSKRIIKVDASGDIDQVHNEVLKKWHENF